MEVSSAILERAAQSLRLLPNVALLSERRPYGLSRPCAGLRLQLPVWIHLLLRRSPIATVATGLGVMIWGGGGRGEGKDEVNTAYYNLEKKSYLPPPPPPPHRSLSLSSLS